MLMSLINVFSSAPIPEGGKKSGRKTPLISYPNDASLELVLQSEPRTPKSQTNSESAPATPERDDSLPGTWFDPQRFDEQLNKEDYHNSARAEVSVYLPKGKTYKDWVTKIRLNPRGNGSVSQWLSDWEQKNEDLG